MKIIRLKKIDSTHNFAIRMIENNSAFECGILADIQTNGVGRCGRKWSSASGNLCTSIIKKLPQNKDRDEDWNKDLYTSILKQLSQNEDRNENQNEEQNKDLYTSILKKLSQNEDKDQDKDRNEDRNENQNKNKSEDICKISLATACAVHKTVKNLLDIDQKSLLYLHWPNDIYYKTKKLSGILLAVIGDWVVISVGLNIRSVSVPTAVSLDEIIDVSNISAQELFYSVLSNLDDEMNLLRTDNFSDIRKYWLQNIIGMNSEVTIRNGKDSLSGIVRGIDGIGRLILERDGKKLYISSGDMFVDEKKIVVDYDEKE